MINKDVLQPKQLDKKFISQEKLLEKFYEKFFENNKNVEIISLEQMRGLKEKGINTELFLDYLCQKHNLLLHGSTHKLLGEELIPNREGKIFASNKAVVSIMKSLYFKKDASLEYPYFIDADFYLKIHVPSGRKFAAKKKGYIYVLDSQGFKNEPNGSWQFIVENSKVKVKVIIETERDDFQYIPEIIEDFIESN